jgi:hypothetical protein
VKFNNELYHFYGSYLNEEHAKLFEKDAEQSAFSEKKAE